MRFALIAALLVVAACKDRAPAPVAPTPAAQKAPPAEAPPESVKEVEPNDFQRAQQIPARAVVSGSIGAPKDDDWYRVDAGGRTLALSVELKGAGELEAYDRDRNRIARTEQGYLPSVACVQACFVRVSGSKPGDYMLTVLGGEPAADGEVEPNNRAVDASVLEAGKPKHGTLYAGDDEDWWKLSLASVQPGQYLRVSVSGVPDVRLELEVRAIDDGALLASFRGGAMGEALSLRDLSLALGQRKAETPDAGMAAEDAGSADDAGVDAGAPDASVTAAPAASGYYLVVKSAWMAGAARGKSVRGANARAPYTISASLESGAADLEQEPNDDAQHATPLSASATGYLAPAGDVDWYKVHLDAPMVAHLELFGADRADLELQVQSGGKTLAKANEVGPRETEVIPSVGLPAGDSYLLVQSAARQLDGKWVRDAVDDETPYKLALTLSADDGATDREPNNDVASAQEAKLPLNAKGWIWPRKDVDVFKFHVDAGHAPVDIRLPSVRGVDLMLRLYELHGDKAEVIGSTDQSKGEGDEQLLQVPLKEGDYAVEVSSPRNKDASATQQYQLTVQ